MWKRDEAVRPPGGQSAAQPHPAAAGTGHRPEASQRVEKDIVNIGKSVVIKGELTGSEDLTIEGQVEGTIQLRVTSSRSARMRKSRRRSLRRR